VDLDYLDHIVYVSLKKCVGFLLTLCVTLYVIFKVSGSNVLALISADAVCLVQ